MKNKIKYIFASLVLSLCFSVGAYADGVGLADKPYSISTVQPTLPSPDSSANAYEGLTYSDWQTEGIFENLYQNGYYILRVQDKLGNISYKPMLIEGLTEKFEVKYVDLSDTGETLNTQTKFIKYGEMAAGSDLGADSSFGKYYPGYYYESCTNMIVTPFDENLVTRRFKARIMKVNFHTEDGKSFSSEEVRYGQGIQTDSYPVKESIYNDSHTIVYEFVGWVTSTGVSVDTNTIKEDLELYPKYEEVIVPNEITIGFHYKDANDTVKYITGRRGEIEPPEPVKEDIVTEAGRTWYSFEYWTLFNGTKVFDISTFTNNVDLYAVYSENYVPVYEPPVLEEKELTEKEVEELVLDKPVVTKEDKPLFVTASKTDIEENPVAKGLATFNQTMADNKEVIGAVAAVGFATVLITALLYGTLGFGIIQSFVFFYALIKKKKRYTNGVWFINRDDIKYVDKYGRPVTVDRSKGVKFYNKKGKELFGVNVDTELNKLNACRISKKEFIRNIRESEVYTVFNADVRIEFNNMQHSGKTVGFNLLSSLKGVSATAGHYTMKVINGGKEMMYELKTSDLNTI